LAAQHTGNSVSRGGCLTNNLGVPLIPELENFLRDVCSVSVLLLAPNTPLHAGAASAALQVESGEQDSGAPASVAVDGSAASAAAAMDAVV
jgi:hypothetical protein